MPYIEGSKYPGPPRWQFNGHLQTIIPNLVRKVEDVPFVRERLELPDGDFLDLDWWKDGNPRIAILTHGLEGNTGRSYIQGMARNLFQNGWDVLAWNCRSCSGEMNRNLRLYFHGDTYDIDQIVSRVLREETYLRIALIGFSMGGSIHMKYLGVKGEEAAPEITHSIAISSPCDIAHGVEVLEQPGNRLYRKRFFRSLSKKMEAKARDFPAQIDISKLEQIESWRDFDEFFSAPINGFPSADAFYHAASAKNFMWDTKVPTLLLNAWNDPILSPSCFPVEEAREHTYLYLECPPQGGHIGFAESRSSENWAEKRTLLFLEQTR
jgi:predicted alpha/beta-fold hydrolase